MLDTNDCTDTLFELADAIERAATRVEQGDSQQAHGAFRINNPSVRASWEDAMHPRKENTSPYRKPRQEKGDKGRIGKGKGKGKGFKGKFRSVNAGFQAPRAGPNRRCPAVGCHETLKPPRDKTVCEGCFRGSLKTPITLTNGRTFPERKFSGKGKTTGKGKGKSYPNPPRMHFRDQQRQAHGADVRGPLKELVSGDDEGRGVLEQGCEALGTALLPPPTIPVGDDYWTHPIPLQPVNTTKEANATEVLPGEVIVVHASDSESDQDDHLPISSMFAAVNTDREDDDVLLCEEVLPESPTTGEGSAAGQRGSPGGLSNETSGGMALSTTAQAAQSQEGSLRAFIHAGENRDLQGKWRKAMPMAANTTPTSASLGDEEVTAPNPDPDPDPDPNPTRALHTSGARWIVDPDSDSEGLGQGEVTYEVPTVAEILVSLQGAHGTVMSKSGSTGSVRSSPASKDEGDDHAPPRRVLKQAHSLQLGGPDSPVQSSGRERKLRRTSDCIPYNMHPTVFNPQEQRETSRDVNAVSLSANLDAMILPQHKSDLTWSKDDTVNGETVQLHNLMASSSINARRLSLVLDKSGGEAEAVLAEARSDLPLQDNYRKRNFEAMKAAYADAEHQLQTQVQAQHNAQASQEASHFTRRSTQDWTQVAQQVQDIMPVAAPPVVPQVITTQNTSVGHTHTNGQYLDRFPDQDTWVHGAFLTSPTRTGEELAMGAAIDSYTHPFDASLASRGGEALNMIPAGQQVPRQDLVGTSPSLSDLFTVPPALDRDVSLGDLSMGFLNEVSDADLDAILAMPIDVDYFLEGDGYEVAAQDARDMGITPWQDGEDTVYSAGLMGVNTDPAPTQVQRPITPDEVMQTNVKRARHDTDGYSK